MKEVAVKTILSKYKTKDWFGLDYNMNLYRGCCHGCIYCDSRSSCYRVENFDEVSVKENALVILRNELARKVRSGVIGTGAMSDPYNPFEKELLLTAHSLELINAYEFGVSIATKSPLILRDIPLLTEIQAHSPVLCKMTITTPHDELARLIEPRVATSSERLEAIATLSDHHLFAGVLLMPVLPFITDELADIQLLVKQVAEAGGRFIYPYFGVTLRENQRDYFMEKVEESFPGMAGRYERAFGSRYSCVSPKQKKLWAEFTNSCQRYGILYKMQDIISAYRQGYGDRQLSFFS